MSDHAFRRHQAAKVLQSRGLPTTSGSLATMATRGGGPPFFKIGRYCMYRLSDLDAWIALRSSELLDSTSCTRGPKVDLNDIFYEVGELEEYPIYSGQLKFDEITRLRQEEDALQEQIDIAASKYDQLFT